MTAAVRLIASILTLAFATAFFGPAHRLLPEKVRTLSYGFIAMALTFFIAAVVRHVLVGQVDLHEILLSHSIYFALLMAILGATYPEGLLLYMAASIGVDLAATVAALCGVDTTDSTLVYAAIA